MLKKMILIYLLIFLVFLSGWTKNKEYGLIKGTQVFIYNPKVIDHEYETKEDIHASRKLIFTTNDDKINFGYMNLVSNIMISPQYVRASMFHHEKPW